ncbi:MAG: hypothetical protein QOJ57_1404 [Thermoleophilaceae bacterium]|nr:hypothetical protein [Thermoleophilaceae bacterium]
MAKRRKEKEDARRAREQERLEAERRRTRNGRIVAVAIAAVAAAIVVFAVSAGGSPDPPSKDQLGQLTDAAAAAGCSVASFPSEGRTHTGTRVTTYKTNPPTSGPHNPIPAPDQAYTVAPPKEYYVHSLEHGRVELQYRPDAPAAVQAAIRQVYDESTEHVLLFPNNTGMDFEVAATAWKHRLGCPSFNARVPAALSLFRDVYRDHGPEAVP